MNANGSKAKKITNISYGGYYGGNPSFSPSGRKVVFVDSGNVYTINTDGSNRTRITHDASYYDGEAIWYLDPVWSPRGTKIAYTKGDEDFDGTRIFVRRLGDSSRKIVASLGAHSPSWSPDGTQIAYVCGVSSSCFGEIHKVKADGFGDSPVTTDPAYDTDPAFSPGGSKIVFSSNRDGDYDIYIMDADGTNVQQLTNNPARDILPDWQPIQ
jgi:Tol biopolymer transport system component